MIVVIDNYDSFTYNLVHLLAQNVAQNVAQDAPQHVAHSVARNVAHGAATHDAPSTDGGRNLAVFRNDRIRIEDIEKLNPDGILISPGPGRPSDAGITCSVIRELSGRFPILGVCLGHQAIGEVFGGTVTYAPTLMHGKTSTIRHDGKTIFAGISQDFVATRYHSLVVSNDQLPDCLHVSATTSDGVIMGLRHRALPVEGIQFHPESLLTVEGPKIIANWMASLRLPA